MSEQGSTLAYAVTERGETGKRKAYAAPGSETGKSNDLCSSCGVFQVRVELTQELRLKVQVPTGTG
jgi:hypothetical protein